MRYYLIILFGIHLHYNNANADVKASKGNIYSVVAPPTGVSASKTNVYSIVAPREGITVSKAVIYSVLVPPSIKQPNVFIFTKLNDEMDIPQSQLEKIVLNATAAN